jgi:hypothetical protein
MTGRSPWHLASCDDDCFKLYLRTEGYLRTVMPISEELSDLLERIFDLNPPTRPSVQELRRAFNLIQTFRMSQADLSLAGPELVREANSEMNGPSIGSHSGCLEYQMDNDSGEIRHYEVCSIEHYKEHYDVEPPTSSLSPARLDVQSLTPALDHAKAAVKAPIPITLQANPIFGGRDSGSGSNSGSDSDDSDDDYDEVLTPPDAIGPQRLANDIDDIPALDLGDPFDPMLETGPVAPIVAPKTVNDMPLTGILKIGNGPNMQLGPIGGITQQVQEQPFRGVFDALKPPTPSSKLDTQPPPRKKRSPFRWINRVTNRIRPVREVPA